MKRVGLVLVVMACLTVVACAPPGGFVAKDPGLRAPGAHDGKPFDNLTQGQLNLFSAGLAQFLHAEQIADGLGPRFNQQSCGICHSQPVTGGTSPAVNPDVALVQNLFPNNTLPSFITPNGPIREARFIKKPDGTPDGGVHNLFVIGSTPPNGLPGCVLTQPDFATALAQHNVIFRIPTPVFGAGLIEAIPDRVILANQQATAAAAAMGIRGHINHQNIAGEANLNGNDGTISRFGWKAQNKSLLLFSGEAYNVEQGITNELFQTEREETPACQGTTVPNDVLTTDPPTPDLLTGLSDIEKFAFFMRVLAPLVPSTDTPGGAPSIARGRTLFTQVGCALCHAPTLQTGNSPIATLANQPVHLFSDLLVHRMGKGLADGVTQGAAGPDEFRTAPLWGLGVRIFFLHDGRTTDLVEAIKQHDSRRSEARKVIREFNKLTEGEKQDLLNFLRSL